MSPNRNNLVKGWKTALTAAGVTLVLAASKYIAGILSDSSVLIADAVHGAADTMAIFASAFGLYLSGKSHSERFPYGLYRAETVMTLLISLFFLYGSVYLFIDGYRALFAARTGGRVQFLPVLVGSISIAVSFVIAIFEYRVSKETGSMSLRINAKESFLDIISSIVVLLGIILPVYRVRYIEGAVIILISLLIFKIGAESAYRSVMVLLDANISDNQKNIVHDIVARVNGVKQIDFIKIRETGPFKMIDLLVRVSPLATVYMANETSEKVRQEIMAALDTVEEVHVEIMPADRDIYNIVVPVSTVDGLYSLLFQHFGKAPYFAIVRISGTETTIVDFYLNEFTGKSKHVGLEVVKKIVLYNIDVLLTGRIGEISFYVLRDHMVDIYGIPDNISTLGDILDMFRSGKLDKITSPSKSIG